MIALEARQLRPPLLRFDPVIPSRVAANPFPGLRRYGPYDADGVRIETEAVLLVFPEPLAPAARELVRALLAGVGNYPGFEAMFRVPLTRSVIIARNSPSRSRRTPRPLTPTPRTIARCASGWSARHARPSTSQS